MSMTGDPPGERRETPPFYETSALPETWSGSSTERETSTRTSTGQRQAARGVDRYLVHLELATDALLGLSLLSAGLLGSGTLGPSWPWLAVGSLLLAITVTLFLRFAFLCWSRSPDPPPLEKDPPPGPIKRLESHRGARTITALVSATAGIVLGYTLLYWTVARIIGLSAFYAAVGTLTAVNPPTPTTTTAHLLLVSQELVDLAFLGGVVTVALGRAFSR